MYKKALLILVIIYMILFGMILTASFPGRLHATYALAEGDVESMHTGEQVPEAESQKDVRPKLLGITGYTSSDNRMIPYSVLKKEEGEMEELIETVDEKLTFPPEEIAALQRIVEAEAGGEDAEGKLLVANVVLNRVASKEFPDTIREVVFQKSSGVTQFSPVANGRYDEVTISDETVEAVERALAGEDISDGALYFAARKYANKKSMAWFDEKLDFLFRHGGHEFFK